MKHTVTALVLSEPRILACPSCSAPLVAVHGERFEVLGGRKNWIRDGDTIQGVYKLLSSSQRDPSGLDCALYVGDCPRCGRDYYIVEAQIMGVTWDDAMPYFANKSMLRIERNSLCALAEHIEGVPRSWVMQEFETPLGVMQSHIFGPWSLDDPGSVIGPHGVASCGSGGAGDPWEHGAALLSKVWDALRAMHPQIGQKSAADAASCSPHFALRRMSVQSN